MTNSVLTKVMSEHKNRECQSQNLHTYTYIQAYITSDVLEHKWRASLKTILLILTSNTEATENKVQFFLI